MAGIEFEDQPTGLGRIRSIPCAQQAVRQGERGGDILGKAGGRHGRMLAAIGQKN